MVPAGVLLVAPATFHIQLAPERVGTGTPEVVFATETDVLTPAVPTFVMVTWSCAGPGAMSIWAPTVSPATLATLTLLSPALAPATSPVVVAAVPTSVAIRTTAASPEPIRTLSPVANPAALAILTLVSPAAAGYTIAVGAPAAVPTPVRVTCCAEAPLPTVSGPPMT